VPVKNRFRSVLHHRREADGEDLSAERVERSYAPRATGGPAVLFEAVAAQAEGVGEVTEQFRERHGESAADVGRGFAGIGREKSARSA
jgi:hypothetical protein